MKPSHLPTGGTLHTHYTELVVHKEVPEQGLTLAKTLDDAQYFIDAQTRLDFVAEVGQRLWAKVTSQGHVLKAELVHLAQDSARAVTA